MPTSVSGRVQVHPRGFGFLLYTVPGPDPDSPIERTAFITPPDLNPLLDGDLVNAQITENQPNRFTATALSVIRRDRTELFGTVVSRSNKPYLRVDRLISNTDWPFDIPNAANLIDGTPIVATIQGDKLIPSRILPKGADVGLERCIVRHGIRTEFPSQVVDFAQSHATTPLAAHQNTRRDLRTLPTVTIDSPTSKDLDDALTALPAERDGAVRVLVSIADVDAFVPEGSVLDAEACARGTSVYLAGRVIPMLPEVISSDAASLIPQVDRLALTVELRIDTEGVITSVDIYESVIRSDARLSYEDVAELISTGHSAGIPESLLPMMRWLRTAAARLSAVRAARGGIELHQEEAYVSLDTTTNEPTGLLTRGNNDAHRLVERLMVAANESVAQWLADRGLGGIFRVHDEPTVQRVQMLEQFSHNFGIEAGFGGRLTPRGLAAFEAQLKTSAMAPAIRTVLGRTLGPARYTPTPGPHFGLGAPLYLHFTSPIRRYADLVVHRRVKRYLQGQRGIYLDGSVLSLIADQLNEQAKRAAKAEAERLRMLAARFFASRIGEIVSGNIVAIKPFGLVIQMLGTGATGTVATEALPNGPYDVDLAHQMLIGPSHQYRVGDSIRASIASCNEELGRIELTVLKASS